jgi:predicted phosphodiesterase
MKQNRRTFIKATASLSTFAALAPESVLGQEVSTSVESLKGKHRFVTKPYLQNPKEKSMTVMWIVNLPSYSYVEYGKTEDLGQVAKSVDNGLVVAYNRINKITMPNLKPGTKHFYRVVSKEIRKFDPYKLEYGETIKSEIYNFTTLQKKQKKVSMVVFNDLHDRPESITHLMNLTDKNSIDFAFFNGDILGHINNEEQIVGHMLKTCSEDFATQTPFYFVRGNHETRGRFARELHHYFANPKGKPYYDFVWGATHFTVIDTGEDKPDDAEVYAGIVDFDNYREEQAAWFKNEVSKSDEFQQAKFRVVLMHIPLYYSGDWHGTMYVRELFTNLFNKAEIDMCINGHTHEYGIYKPSKREHDYPIIIGGGYKKGNRTIIKLNADNKNLGVSIIRDDGVEVGNYKLATKR